MRTAPLSRDPAHGSRHLSFRGAWRLLARWHRRRRQRLDLAELGDDLLADIGVAWTEAGRGCVMPFWR